LKNNIIKIADLGVAKKISNSLCGMSDNGNNGYASPEMIELRYSPKAKEIVTKKTDIWFIIIIINLLFLDNVLFIK